MTRATPTARGNIRPITDDTIRLVRVWGSTSYTRYHASHHGEPACGIEPTKGEFDEWPVEQARAWRDPCSYCFPDGDSQ